MILYGSKEDSGKILGIIPFSETSSTDDLTISIPPEAKKLKEIILVLPDYVTGNSIYPFTSGKRSVAEPFIRRKLAESFPASPDMSDLFNYSYFKTSRDPGSLYAFYLKEPLAFSLYNRLTEAGLRPDRITTPAYIWQDKIGKLSDAEPGGSFCLIHPLQAESYLYFYVNGNFLFSRSIILPESSEGKMKSLTPWHLKSASPFIFFPRKSNRKSAGSTLCLPQILMKPAFPRGSEKLSGASEQRRKKAGMPTIKIRCPDLWRPSHGQISTRQQYLP